MILIRCKNTNTECEFQEGMTLLDMLGHFDFDRPFDIVTAKVNNVSQGLKYRVYNSKTIEFLDVRDPSGMRIYTRSLCFLLTKAVHDVFPESKLYVEMPISNGCFCNLHTKKEPLTADDVQKIKERMKEIVAKNIPFHRFEVPTDEAIGIFKKAGYDDKVKLLQTSGQVYTNYYTLDDTPDYYYGRLVPSTGYLKCWDIELYNGGILLRLPDMHNPDSLAPFVDQPKTFEMFNENLRWNIIMGLNTVGDVNCACQKGRASELIQVSEALQEKRVVYIAEEIERRHRDGNMRLVLISGPSSSGKTTFCKRLSVQLKACGLRPVSFSTDDYFVNRIDTPLLPDGHYDFDNFDTVDHASLQRDLVKILEGETVEIPEYNFVTGRREYNGKKLRLEDNTVILLEGIHALNPRLTDEIDETSKFRIFISTLTSIALDNHNWIPTADCRLLRRIVRDYNKGAFTARQSINQWPNVLDAEEKWIYPYQENADVMFNSALLIEFAVLRNHAEPILMSVQKNCPEYAEAHRLLRFIRYFDPVPDKEIPPTSLLREFLGGSSFTY